MNRPLTNTEFYTYEGDVWVFADGAHSRLTQSDTEIIDGMLEIISTFYPKAYRALTEEYKGCALNKPYYRFRIVSRFVKCNFAQLDNQPDVDDNYQFSFEYVPCPLRGECPLDRIVCRPEFDHKLSSGEVPVLRLWYEGRSIEEISEQLCLSPHTVHNHIRHAYQRLGAHSRSEFVKFASEHNIFGV